MDNLGRLGDLVAEGVKQGAQLLVLPEMCWTGYLWPNAGALLPYAEQAGAGLGQTQLARWAVDFDVWLVFGFPEVAGTQLYNSQAVASPDGKMLPLYRKSHLFEADQWWAQPGDTGYRTWGSPWGTLGSGICMDLNYPDLVEFHSVWNTDILTFSTNWVDQGFDVIPYWEACLAGRTRAGFRGAALFADRGGNEFGVGYRGQSAVFVGGRCVAALPGTTDGVLVADLP